MFVVYSQSNNQIIVGIYATQAAAVARAAEDADYVVGAQQVTNSWAEPGYYYNTDADGNSSREAPPSRAADAHDWKARLAICGRVVENGLKAHWRHMSDANDGATAADENTAAQRYNNTEVWAGTWVGYPWEEVLKYEANQAGAMTRVQLDTLVGQAEGELLGADRIFVWYLFHHIAVWKGYRDGRQIWTTNFSTATGKNTALGLNLIKTAANLAEYKRWGYDSYTNAAVFSG